MDCECSYNLCMNSTWKSGITKHFVGLADLRLCMTDKFNKNEVTIDMYVFAKNVRV
jgi:hypothetical protein